MRFLCSVVIVLCGVPISINAQSIIRVGNARFTVIAPECIRMEYSSTGKFVDAPSYVAVNRKASAKEFKKQLANGGAIIGTKRMTLHYTPDGKPFSSANLSIDIRTPAGAVRWAPGMKNIANLEGTIRTLDQVNARVPLGDGLLSRDGWYLLDDSQGHLLIENWVQARPADSGTDWYFFAYGTDYKSALRALTAISGGVPLPRKYQLGSWYSRYWPYSSSDYRDIVDEYAKNDFPLDVMVLDMDWHKDGWTGWSWNRKLLPDAENLLSWLHNRGLFVTLNLHPADGVKPHEDAYRTFMKDMGVSVAGIPDTSLPALPYDVGSQKYMTTLFDDVHAPLEKNGVDFWWLDWQQYPYTRSIPTLENLPWLNESYFRNSEKNGLRGASFSRWGGWGDHRHPIHFSGDADIHFPMLEFEIPFTSTAGNVGCFFWSHDIGGHMDMTRKNPRDDEAYTRWTQFGALSAALRIHSTRNKDMDRRPWLYPKECTEAMRIAFHVRSELFPYIYTSAAQSSRQSVPLVRPMYIDYPGNENAYQNPQEYLFGDNLLAAPVATAGTGPGKVAPQRVWFPQGLWYQWFSGEKFSSGERSEIVWSDLNEFPLFARGGVPIPLQPYIDRMTTAPLSLLVVRCFPGVDGVKKSSELYEDDGVSNAYKKSERAVTAMSYARHGKEVTVVIEPAKGSYNGQLKNRSYRIELPCTEKAVSITVNEKKIIGTYDGDKKVNTILVPSTSIRKKIVIAVTMSETNPEHFRNAAWRRRRNGIAPELHGSREEMLLKLSTLSIGDAEQQRLVSFLTGVNLLGGQKDGATVALSRDCKSVEGLTAAIQVNDGYKTRTLSNQPLTATSGASFFIEAAKLPAPELGSESTRSIEVSFAMEGKLFTLKRELSHDKTFLSKWNVIGPFAYDDKRPIGAQSAISETNAMPDLTKSFRTMNGTSASWRPAPERKDGRVVLSSLYGTQHCLAYALTCIRSEQEQKVRFGIGSDDGVEMWINGNKVHSNDTMRSYTAESDTVETILPKGISTILMKITQGDGGWEFGVSVKAEYGLREFLQP